MKRHNLKRFGTAANFVSFKTLSSSCEQQKRRAYSLQQKKIAEYANAPGQQDAIVRVTAAAGD